LPDSNPGEEGFLIGAFSSLDLGAVEGFSKVAVAPAPPVFPPPPTIGAGFCCASCCCFACAILSFLFSFIDFALSSWTFLASSAASFCFLSSSFFSSAACFSYSA